MKSHSPHFARHSDTTKKKKEPPAIDDVRRSEETPFLRGDVVLIRDLIKQAEFNGIRFRSLERSARYTRIHPPAHQYCKELLVFIYLFLFCTMPVLMSFPPFSLSLSLFHTHTRTHTHTHRCKVKKVEGSSVTVKMMEPPTKTLLLKPRNLELSF